MVNYAEVTEVSGELVSREQVQRMAHRYVWAGRRSQGKDVLEIACGSGQGLGCLSAVANTLVAGDISQELVEKAKAHYQSSVDVKVIDAMNLPFANDSLDVVILFEAIYYLPDAAVFVAECKRVLRSGGKLLISTSNKDLYDFNPSPYSFKYYGVKELDDLLRDNEFKSQFYGYLPISSVSIRQKILRPIKAIAAKLNLIPKTMAGKLFLKKLVFGGLVEMPAELKESMIDYVEPLQISNLAADNLHKVIYCEATLKAQK